MQYNTTSGRFEVALRVPLADLQQMAQRMSPRPSHPADAPAQAIEHPRTVDAPLAVDEAFERLVQRYVGQHFYLQAGLTKDLALDKTQPPMSDTIARERCTSEPSEWVGMEIDRTIAWLYFELTPPANAEQLYLVNRVFLDLNKGQSNTVVLISPVGRFALKTYEAEPAQVMPMWRQPTDEAR